MGSLSLTLCGTALEQGMVGGLDGWDDWDACGAWGGCESRKGWGKCTVWVGCLGGWRVLGGVESWGGAWWGGWASSMQASNADIEAACAINARQCDQPTVSGDQPTIQPPREMVFWPLSIWQENTPPEARTPAQEIFYLRDGDHKIKGVMRHPSLGCVAGCVQVTQYHKLVNTLESKLRAIQSLDDGHSGDVTNDATQHNHGDANDSTQDESTATTIAGHTHESGHKSISPWAKLKNNATCKACDATWKHYAAEFSNMRHVTNSTHPGTNATASPSQPS